MLAMSQFWGSEGVHGNTTLTNNNVIGGLTFSNVKKIFMGETVGVVLFTDGTIRTFGNTTATKAAKIENIHSSNTPSNYINSTLVQVVPNHSPIKTIQSSLAAFAVLHEDGTISTWGEPSQGGAFYIGRREGTGNNQKPQDSSYTGTPFTNIKYIASTQYAFAALHNDGKVTVWGGSSNNWYGGQFNNTHIGNSQLMEKC